MPLGVRAIACIPLACLLSGTGVAHGQDAPHVADSVHVTAVVAVGKGVPEGAVWPGYTGPEEFVVCTRTGRTILALLMPPPGEWSATLVNASSDSTASVYVLQSILPELERSCVKMWNWSFDGRNMFAFPALDSVYTIRDPLVALTTTLFHEGFHLYQMEHFARTQSASLAPLEEPPAVSLDLVTSSKFQDLASEERRVLADALRVEALDSLQPLLARYLRLRKSRMALVPGEQRATEGHNERKEGSAQLVGYEAALLALENSTHRVSEIVRADLLATPPFDANPRMTSYRHWHIYATGSAIGLILDRMNVDWRYAVQEGSTFIELLERAVAEADG